MIKMVALKSFYGEEGNVSIDDQIEVKTEQRAVYLESKGLAERKGAKKTAAAEAEPEPKKPEAKQTHPPENKSEQPKSTKK
jgi:hypothetical protein